MALLVNLSNLKILLNSMVGHLYILRCPPKDAIVDVTIHTKLLQKMIIDTSLWLFFIIQFTFNNIHVIISEIMKYKHGKFYDTQEFSVL